MDDMLEKSREGVRLDSRGRGGAAPEGSTFLGGMPDQRFSNLTGCISNVFIKRCHVPSVLSCPHLSSPVLSSPLDVILCFISDSALQENQSSDGSQPVEGKGER